MNKKKFKKILVSFLFFGMLSVPAVVSADVVAPVSSGGGLVSFDTHGYFDPMQGKDIPVIVGNIIAKVLPVIGALFLIMFIYGGSLWMTAGGDETKVKKARQTLVNTAIGMGIVVGAYVIVYNILTIFNPG